MFIEPGVGRLTEPLTGRSWDRNMIHRYLWARIARLQGHGMSVSDVVFIHYGNTLEYFVDLLAIWNLGACAIPVDPQLTGFEVETLARAAGPRFSIWLGSPDESVAGALSAMGVEILDSSEISDGGAAAHAKPKGGPGSFFHLDDPALVLFTSGTTGNPKGVVHTHRSLRARWFSLRQSLGMDAFRRSLCLLPTHMGHGLICNSLFPWLSGQDLFILPAFQPDVITRVGTVLDENGITFMSSVPAVWRLALKTSKPPRKRGLQRVFCGSAPLTAVLWKDIQEWTGAGEVFNSYGITETGSWVGGTTVPGFLPEDGLIGEAWGGVIKILKSSSTESHPDFLPECSRGEPGYVWINTPALMKGYLGRDDLTRKVVSQGWYVSGDIGVIDERGWLYLKGRERDEINKGGAKVYPDDIDAVAGRYEQTLDVCTFGFEDPLLGENVGIAVVLKEATDANLRSLMDQLRIHLGKYQIPRRVYVLDEIPRTSRGKLNRREIADRCAPLEPVDLRKLYR